MLLDVSFATTKGDKQWLPSSVMLCVKGQVSERF